METIVKSLLIATKHVAVSKNLRDKLNKIDLMLLTNFQNQVQTLNSLKRSYVIEVNSSIEFSYSTRINEELLKIEQDIADIDSALYFINEAIALLLSKYQ